VPMACCAARSPHMAHGRVNAVSEPCATIDNRQSWLSTAQHSTAESRAWFIDKEPAWHCPIPGINSVPYCTFKLSPGRLASHRLGLIALYLIHELLPQLA
jgi:hypothetical protein